MPFKYIVNENGHYVCPTCNVVKEKMNTMHYHLKNHDGNYPYECNICKDKFMHKKTLENHIVSRHSDNNEKLKPFKCVFPDCISTSLTKGNRRIHCSRKHFKEESEIIREDNKCTVCNKTFKSDESFDYHVLSCITVSDDKKAYLEQILV